MQMPTFSILIVNYNGGDYLAKALDSIATQTRRDFELILIDNASTDGSLDPINLDRFPSATLVKNSENLGFARANNMAAAAAKGRWLVLLNPDASADPDWLDKLATASKAHPDYKVFTSAQFDMHAEDEMDGAGDAYLLFGIPWRGGFGLPRTALPENGLCFSGCGAGVMYDRALFRELGGFDERFFCYCEDVDLGFRMQLTGEECVFVSDAVIHHAGSGIAGAQSAFSIYHGTRNRIWTYFKNMPWAMLVLTLPVHIALSIYLLVRSAFTRRFVPTLKGMRDGLAGLPRMLMSRDWKAPRRKVSLAELSRTMAWNPFRLSRRAPHVRPFPAEGHGFTGRS